MMMDGVSGTNVSLTGAAPLYFSPCEWHIDGVSLELDTPMQSLSGPASYITALNIFVRQYSSIRTPVANQQPQAP